MTETLTAQREQIKPATFTVDGPTFAEAIAPAVKVAKGGGHYAAVILSFRDQRVTVAATDFETTVSLKVPVKGKKATSVAVHPERLGKFGKLFPLGDVEIDVSKEGVKFTVGTTELAVPPVWDAPAIGESNLPAHTAKAADVEFARLAASVRVVGSSASPDAARPVLTGIRFEAGTAVATDSYRLAVHYAAPSTLTGLFPAKALAIAVALFGQAAEVQHEIIGSKLVLRTADRAIAIRAIDGEYPNWRNLLTSDSAIKTTVKIPRKALSASLDKVGLAGDKDTACRAQIERHTMLLTMTKMDVASSLDPLEVEVDGDLQLVGFNPGYLRSLISGVDAEVLAIDIIDAMKPFTIQAADVDEHTFRLLQMPVRLP